MVGNFMSRIDEYHLVLCYILQERFVEFYIFLGGWKE